MQKPKLKEESTEVSKYQKFEAVTIHRSEIKNAPYNPRFIDKHARVKLKNKIEKDGLVEALTWNERTKNLVSGHQRISILDELNETPDYNLTVCKINVSEKKEKELNVFLNNSAAQGMYDFDLLNKLFSEEDISIPEFGFDDLDIKEIKGESVTESFFSGEKGAVTKEQIDKIKAARTKMKETGEARDNADYMLIAVFQDYRSLDSFLDKLKLPKDNKYIDGNRLLDLVTTF
jgi:hypothetical protein